MLPPPPGLQFSSIPQIISSQNQLSSIPKYSLFQVQSLLSHLYPLLILPIFHYKKPHIFTYHVYLWIHLYLSPLFETNGSTIHHSYSHWILKWFSHYFYSLIIFPTINSSHKTKLFFLFWMTFIQNVTWFCLQKLSVFILWYHGFLEHNIQLLYNYGCLISWTTTI